MLQDGSPYSTADEEQPPGGPTQYAWNPPGRGLISQRYEYPIVAVDAVEGARLRSLARANAAAGYNKFPQHAVRFNFYMGPANLNSVSCLQQASCLPLGGQSVWGSLGQLDAAHGVAQRPIVMAVAPLDAAELFHELAFGAGSSAASVVALLAAADALSQTDAAALPSQILFGAFQAEAWGRVGSRRWLADVQSFSCQTVVPAGDSPNGRAYCANPLKPDITFASVQLADIQTVVTVDQMGGAGVPASGAYVHEVNGRGPEGTLPVYTALNGVATKPMPVQIAAATGAPPPTPVLSFQAAAPTTIDAAVIAGYDAAFADQYYFSRFDNGSTVSAAAVTASATLLAQGLYALAAAGSAAVPPTLAANASFVAAALSCITVNAQCALFSELLGVDIANLGGIAGPLSLYAGVYNQPYAISGGYVIQPSPLEAFVRNSLALATSTARNGTCASTPACQEASGKIYECIMGQCVIANAFYHDALSPALSTSSQFGAYSVNQAAISAVDPLWTEPYWSYKIGATAFLKDTNGVAAGALAAGIIVAVASIVGARYLVRYLDTHYKVP